MNVINLEDFRKEKDTNAFFNRLANAFGIEAAQFFFEYAEDMNKIVNNYFEIIENSLSLNQAYKAVISLAVSDSVDKELDLILAKALMSNALELEDTINEQLETLMEEVKYNEN